MSQLEKLLRRIRNLDKNLRFDEVQKVLEMYGYEAQNPRGGSSHCTFRKAGHYRITIPRHEPIKTVYVRMVKDVIEEAENHEKH